MAGVEVVNMAKARADPVEMLLEKGIATIPEKYIRPPQERFFTTADLECEPIEQVPVIDLQGLNSCHEYEREEVLKQIASACEEWGFFQIVNHGIPQSLMDDMMDICKGFFGCSVEEKQTYAALPGLITQGYGSKYVQREDATRDWRDFLFLMLQPHSIRDYTYWPSSPPNFREVLQKYSEETFKVAKKLIAAFSVTLGLPENCLEKAIVEPYQKMLINYYPPCPQPELTAGFYSHSDIGIVTLLLQESGSKALQIKKNDSWIPVIAARGAILVNVADQMEILSNGKYKSIEHRVVADKDKARISIPMFCDAAPQAIIKPASELLGKKMENGGSNEKAKYSSIVFENHEIAFYTDGANSKKYVQSYIISS